MLRGFVSRFVVLGWLAAVVPSPLLADRVELVNGDVVTGTITRVDATSVVVETEFGTLTIPRDRVLRGVFGNDDGLGEAGLPASADHASDDGSSGGASVAIAPDTDERDGSPGREVDVDLPDGPLFHFPLDGSLRDQMNRYDLVNNGMSFVADRNGEARSALLSGGDGTFLSVASDDRLSALSAFTLTFDVRLDDISGTRYLVSKWDQARGELAEGKFTVQTADGSLTVFLVEPGGRYHWLSSRSALQAGVWHSVAVQFVPGASGGGSAGIWVDGEQVRSRSLPFNTLSADDAPLLVMTAESNTEDRFSRYNAAGAVDDLRLYDRVLDASEIRAIAAGE